LLYCPTLRESILPENFHYDVSEVCFGKDSRRIRIPLNVDQDSAETCIKDGLLCIKFKKLETHAPKKLEIK
jgi:HSP20 family molecular chaperone IbpA